MQNLEEGKDYYLDPKGLLVFTKEYHLMRGYCCNQGCTNCPYELHACPYCQSKRGTVFVHGHYQCQDCKTNIDPCCRGENNLDKS